MNPTHKKTLYDLASDYTTHEVAVPVAPIEVYRKIMTIIAKNPKDEAQMIAVKVIRELFPVEVIEL